MKIASSTNIVCAQTLNWNLCMFCQSDTSESLLDPVRANVQNRTGYVTLANQLERLHQINFNPLKVQNLNDIKLEGSFEKSLTTNQTK